MTYDSAVFCGDSWSIITVIVVFCQYSVIINDLELLPVLVDVVRRCALVAAMGAIRGGRRRNRVLNRLQATGRHKYGMGCLF